MHTSLAVLPRCLIDRVALFLLLPLQPFPRRTLQRLSILNDHKRLRSKFLRDPGPCQRLPLIARLPLLHCHFRPHQLDLLFRQRFDVLGGDVSAIHDDPRGLPSSLLLHAIHPRFQLILVTGLLRDPHAHHYAVPGLGGGLQVVAGSIPSPPVLHHTRFRLAQTHPRRLRIFSFRPTLANLLQLLQRLFQPPPPFLTRALLGR